MDTARRSRFDAILQNALAKWEMDSDWSETNEPTVWTLRASRSLSHPRRPLPSPRKRIKNRKGARP